MNKIFVLLTLLVLSFSTKADEGMWMLPYIEQLNMREMGSELNTSQIYNTDSASIKDAIVVFGNGCTGEIISDQGLILTNHHCGYSTIQQHSSVENDYLKDGCWAKSREDEIPSPDLSVTFVREIKNITEDVLSSVNADMEYAVYKSTIDSISKIIIEKSEEESGLSAQVKSFYAGNKYYLFLTEKYTDIRFVGAPPSSIGKFGADTDNWMWPRHTGDFSLFRVYANAEGKPAEYCKENIPLVPKYHLPITLKGPKNNEFAMTIGFPGSTNRYLTSFGIKERVEVINEARIVVRHAKQKIWLEDMLSEQKIRIQYASKYSRSTNYYKNSIGMNRGIKNLRVLQSKKALETEFENWVSSSPSGEPYAETLSLLKEGYNLRRDIMRAKYFYSETFKYGIELFNLANMAKEVSKLNNYSSQKSINEAFLSFSEEADKFYKNYNSETDRKTMISLLEIYTDHVDPDFYPSIYEVIREKYKGSYENFTNKLFKTSIFADREKLFTAIENKDFKSIKKDRCLLYATDLAALKKEIDGTLKSFDAYINKGNRQFEAGLHEMNAGKVYYPDANFTIRMSAGKVGDYKPRDGVRYNFHTTLKGVMEKEDPNNWEFVVPEKLKQLYTDKDFGNYANANGTMPVCFTTNNDITGGNSGSPVINSKGELFGLAFDGNWEAMSGDIAFEPELQKCINVNIRYVLFIIDKFGDAHQLIDEMTIIE